MAEPSPALATNVTMTKRTRTGLIPTQTLPIPPMVPVIAMRMVALLIPTLAVQMELANKLDSFVVHVVGVVVHMEVFLAV